MNGAEPRKVPQPGSDTRSPITSDTTVESIPMKSTFIGLLLGLSMACGCSQETQEKAGEAARATGQALESAAEDAATNTKEAAQDVEESLDADNADTDTVE
jgi:hypothetical protein